MRRVFAFVMIVVMLATLCASAFAWEESWKINPKNGGTFKKSPTNHIMPDSGSFWRATYMSGDWPTSQAYIYKRGYGQVTPKYSFSKGVERRALNYLKDKVVGDTYWIVVSNKNGTTVKYDYHF